MKKKSSSTNHSNAHVNISRAELLKAMNTLQLPETLRDAWFGTSESHVLHTNDEQQKKYKVQFTHSIEHIMHDQKLKTALQHALMHGGCHQAEYAEEKTREPALARYWREVLVLMSKGISGDLVHEQDGVAKLRVFEHEWEAVSDKERNTLRFQLLEKLRHAFFTHHASAH